MKPYFLIMIILISGCASSGFEHPFTVGQDVVSTPVTGVQDSRAMMPEGWSTPVKLQVSDEGREDSTYITRDGRYVLFYYDPTENFMLEQEEGVDPKIFYTERPFIEKYVHPVSEGIDPNAEAGPYISLAGDLYYTSTFIVIDPTPRLAHPQRTKNNSQVIDAGTNEHENNPHYCDLEDELYFDTQDQAVWVYKNGKSTKLSYPINTNESQNFQPFLTDDCQTMYFSSTRDATVSLFPIQVYKSERLGEFEWSEPEIFVAYDQRDGRLGGVGEFSMTRDHKQMVFTELSIENDRATNEMYYSEMS